MITINLIPSEYIDREKQKALVGIAGVGIGIIVIVVGAFSLMLMMKNQALARQKAELEEKVRKLDEIAKEVDALEERKRGIEAKNGVVHRLLNGRLDYPRFMEALVESLPPNQVAVSSIDIKKTNNIFGLKVSAQGSGDRSVIKWLERLEERPAFSKVVLGGITYASVGSVTFQIEMEYQLAE